MCDVIVYILLPFSHLCGKAIPQAGGGGPNYI